MGFPGGSEGKASTCNVGDPGSSLGQEDPWRRKWQYCCLENPMDGGAWSGTVHGFAQSRTRLSDFTLTFDFNLFHVKL